MTPEQRFWIKVDRSADCWTWLAVKNAKGYGLFWFGGRNVKAHRFVYELTVGPIPDGLEMDHLCRNTSCVNPGHLEPVAQRENARRRRRTYCGRGHEYTEANTYQYSYGRQCRACALEYRHPRPT